MMPAFSSVGGACQGCFRSALGLVAAGIGKGVLLLIQSLSDKGLGFKFKGLAYIALNPET
jgi:hypothetical protein